MNKLKNTPTEIPNMFCCPTCKGSLKKDKQILLCKKCKSEYNVLNDIPILLKESLLTKYSFKQIEYFSDSIKEPPIFIGWMDSFMQRLYQNLNFTKNTLILDLATGDGYSALKLAKKGYDVIALDFTFPTLLRLKREAKKQKLLDKIHFVCADATALPLKNRFVDITIANAILEHIPKERKAISEVNRVSKKRAGLMVVVPLAYRYIWPFFIPVNYYHDKRIGHLRRYSKKDFESKFKSWNIKQVYYTGHLIKVALFLIAYTFKLRFLDNTAEKTDSLFMNKPYGASNITVFMTKSV